jgi:hypothetical protein
MLKIESQNLVWKRYGMIPKNEVNPRFHGLHLLLSNGAVQDSLPRLSDDSSKRYNFEFVDGSKHLDFLPLSKVPKMFETTLLSIIHQK